MALKRKLTLHIRRELIRREIIQKNTGLQPKYKQAKFEKMSASPYAFFRGSNHLFWEDFYNDWRLNLFGGKEATLTWINGDAHIYNYGAYANHYGDVIFGMDDFDDSIIADYQYDLWRMAISIVLDCRYNNMFDHHHQYKALEVFCQAYLNEITSYKADDIHKEVELTSETTSGILQNFIKKVEDENDRGKMLKKWTIEEGSNRRFKVSKKKLSALDKEEYKKMHKVMSQYPHTLKHDFSGVGEGYFNIKDIVRRLWSGTGSLGLDRFYVLLEGDATTDDDDIILDVKELDKPPLYYHMHQDEQQIYNELFQNEGERFINAFSSLAEHPDKYLGWFNYNGKVFSVREKSPFKADFPTEVLKIEDDLYFMVNVWGRLLATRHERASHKLNDDPYTFPKTMEEICRGKEKQFIDMVIEISFNYADCVEQDWICFKEDFGINS